ncbi:hypothetical protein TrLO_g2018 [Triparma laevis f. longispina]|nr:hypothetical protein TrLO_g2018 [Triparma laevis f. longispina]
MPSSVEDLGFTSRAAEGVLATGDQNSPGLQKSLGHQIYKVRGTSMGNYYFHKFPYDQQELNITIQMPDLPLRKAKFVTRADATSSSDGAGNLPLWETTCVSSSVDTVDENSKGISVYMAEDDPYGTYMAKLDELDQITGISEMYAHQDVQANAETDNEAKVAVYENYQKWSTVTLTIQVSRKPDFYPYNFVLVVALLVFVSFFSFHMEKSGLGDRRLGLTLTIVLGLNVFQIVIIDNMPATGYLTNMHNFLLVSTEIVMGVAVENLIVNAAAKRRAALEATLGAFLMAVDKPKPKKREGKEVEMSSMDSSVGTMHGNTLLGGTPKDADLESNMKTNPMVAKGLRKFKSKASSGMSQDTTESVGKGESGGGRQKPAFERSKRRDCMECFKSWNRIIIWIDDYLDYVSTIVFPLVFAYFFLVLQDEGEMGEQGVIEARC